MTAAEVKKALYRRHAATTEFGPGPWTCVEEWHQIDFLAFAAWTQPKPARCRHARIGYEVKVSRSDYKRELERPFKRAGAVAFCHEFYFAVPEGLLKTDEIEWIEPSPDAPDAAEVRARAPLLWVPADCGLVIVSGRGTPMVIRRAPLNRDPSPIADGMLADLVRWVSYRPDTRHAKLSNLLTNGRAIV